MSQLSLEELFSSGSNRTHAPTSRIRSGEAERRLGISGSRWEINTWTPFNKGRQGNGWRLLAGAPYQNEQGRASAHPLWLLVRHNIKTLLSGYSVSGFEEATENTLADEGIEISLQDAVLHRLSLSCDIGLSSSPAACHAAVRFLCCRTPPVQWSVQMSHLRNHEDISTQCRVTARVEGKEALLALRAEHDELTAIWAHLIRDYPPGYISTTQGPKMASYLALHLASSDVATIVRELFLTLGVWNDPTFTPHRIIGQLPDEARVWDIEAERQRLLLENQSSGFLGDEGHARRKA